MDFWLFLIIFLVVVIGIAATGETMQEMFKDSEPKRNNYNPYQEKPKQVFKPRNDREDYLISRHKQGHDVCFECEVEDPNRCGNCRSCLNCYTSYGTYCSYCDDDDD